MKNDKELLYHLLTDSNNPVHYAFINNKEMSDLAEYLVKNGVTVNKAAIGCHLLNNVKYHDENGIRVIDNFQIDSVSLVSCPVDDNCVLHKESED